MIEYYNRGGNANPQWDSELDRLRLSVEEKRFGSVLALAFNSVVAASGEAQSVSGEASTLSSAYPDPDLLSLTENRTEEMESIDIMTDIGARAVIEARDNRVGIQPAIGGSHYRAGCRNASTSIVSPARLLSALSEERLSPGLR